MFNFFKKKEPQLSGSEMALLSLNHLATAIRNNEIDLQRGNLFEDVYLHVDKPQDRVRFTYVIFSPTEQNKPIAKLSCITRGAHENAPLWDVDWAVDPKYQGKKWGLTIAVKASEEFKNGMRGKYPNGYWLEAIVDDANEPSKIIASRIIGGLEIIKTKTNNNVFNYRNHFE
ncbi:MAG: hypothetical protein RR311_01195 [Comamonas sp.]